MARVVVVVLSSPNAWFCMPYCGDFVRTLEEDCLWRDPACPVRFPSLLGVYPVLSCLEYAVVRSPHTPHLLTSFTMSVQLLHSCHVSLVTGRTWLSVIRPPKRGSLGLFCDTSTYLFIAAARRSNGFILFTWLNLNLNSVFKRFFFTFALK